MCGVFDGVPVDTCGVVVGFFGVVVGFCGVAVGFSGVEVGSWGVAVGTSVLGLVLVVLVSLEYWSEFRVGVRWCWSGVVRWSFWGVRWSFGVGCFGRICWSRCRPSIVVGGRRRRCFSSIGWRWCRTARICW